MNEYETASLAVANANLDVAKAHLAIARDGLAIAREGIDVAAGNMLAAIIAATGIWVFGIGMLVQNWRREKAEQRRAEAERRRAEQAAEAQKVTQGMLAALERQGDALAEILRRTSPTSPPPGPAE